MATTLPFIPGNPDYAFTTALGGVAYAFDVTWNDRDEAWYFTISDAEGDEIRTVKIVLGVLLGDRSTDPRWPEGLFMVSDSSGEQRDAGIDDLGARVRVLFLSFDDAEDLATIVAMGGL